MYRRFEITLFIEHSERTNLFVDVVERYVNMYITIILLFLLYIVDFFFFFCFLFLFYELEGASVLAMLGDRLFYI